ncbi:MAG TPA: hypothetical protein VH722_21570 [Alphaproteobacteria bacterium]|nr:hypothetical protein [Alphaproteobacteria bacterium]
MASATAHSQPPSVSPALQAELKQVIVGNCPAVRKEDCAKSDELNVRVVKLFGDYAKVTVSRVDGQGEAEVAYLKRKEDGWVLLDEGTMVNPVELGVPEEAR